MQTIAIAQKRINYPPSEKETSRAQMAKTAISIPEEIFLNASRLTESSAEMNYLHYLEQMHSHSWHLGHSSLSQALKANANSTTAIKIYVLFIRPDFKLLKK